VVTIASPGAIIGAARAARAASPSGQGAATGPTGNTGPSFGQISPLVAQIGGGPQAGYATGYGSFLPRSPRDFQAGAFGPFAPVFPMAIDQPPDGAERAMPRRLPYQVGWNLPVGQPGTEGVKLADFQTLRSLAGLYSVARACIQLLKAEIRGLEWDIIPTKDAAKAMRGDPKAMSDFGERRAQAVAFFKNPDPEYGSWGSWLDTLLEDLYSIDAMSVYLRPTWGKGKGLLGSDLTALELIAGDTLRPLYDLHGSRPRPPAPAFQQYLWGVPRVDLMQLITQGDLTDELKAGQVAEYRGDQVLYMPYTRQTISPYGLPPIEQALVPIMSGLGKQQYQMDFFREGSIPGMFVSPGDVNMTPSQIRELQDALNALAGDVGFKHKIIVLPPGSKTDPQKPPALADQFDEVIMAEVCMAFNVMPMEIGLTPKVSMTQSPGAANQMAKACYTRDVEILTRRGWLPFDAVKTGDDGDEFATRNPKTQAFEWQHATAYHEYDHDGELVEFTSTHGRQPKDEGLHLRVTPNHRMVTVEPIAKSKPVSYREYIREAGEIRGQRISIPLTSTWKGCGPQSVTFGKYEWAAADFAALLGAYIAEGHLRRQRGYYKRGGQWVRRGEDHIVKQICISQRETSKGFEAYRNLLTRMLGREPGYNHGTFYFACTELWDYLNDLGHAHEKHIPAEVKDWSVPALESLLHHYLLGDGYLENGLWRAKTVSSRLADDLQEVAQKLGMSATITVQHPKDVMIRGRLIAAENCRDVYLVRFNRSLTRRMTISRTNYTGKVYCVTVPNGIIYVRANGSPVWCGNSQDIHARKSLIPTLQFLKESLFDKILQVVCKQDDLQWMPEGLEQDEDEETLTTLLVSQIGAGLSSIDEARAELNKDPWGVPITSDPLWASQTGIVPLASLDPSTGQPVAVTPEVPGQPPMPAQEPGLGGSQPPPGAPKPPAGAAPGGPAGAPAGAAKPPPKPAGTPTSPGAGNAGQTPGHEAAEAGSHVSAGGRGQGSNSGPSTASAVGKAAWAELDALERHLRKGRDVATWEPRHIGGKVLEVVRYDLGDGQSITTAVADARTVLAKGGTR